eukprot:CAMPEP_0114499620 /NCGR_PEP_ID=MMETSP0109-20121206/7518_1 /TAXON_ID=29199 /ORGANISM="Chlorarachnion reptans, Strain CCCM449" /LENGTH=230 /DNA_ID=CAMNT_0001677207 /DNA_START=16 /DNA_END=708 /DNA_ORIENTATION=-
MRDGEVDDPGKARLKQRLKENTFIQQRLPAWRPLIRPRCIISVFTTFGVAFLIIGGLIISASRRVKTTDKRYDDICRGMRSCSVEIDIHQDMEAPIYFYYKLVNFYQNHRSYVQDFDITQLQGEADDTSSCTISEAENRNGKPVYPCGIIANSFFNDVFSVTRNQSNGDQTIFEGNDWDGSDISWKSDRERKFKNVSDASDLNDVSRIGTNGNTLPFPTNQDFQVQILHH